MPNESNTSTEEYSQLRLLGSTNTQTRRLGYLIGLLEILNKAYLPREALARRLLRWSKEHQQHLEDHKSSKGIVRTRTAANRYIDLASDLRLVGVVNEYYRPTEVGRLMALISQSQRNPFALQSVDLLLLYQLFATDSDYLIPALELVDECSTQRSILSNTQQHLASRLISLQSILSKPKERDKASERVSSIRDWKSPEAYSEHLLIPRIHWLVDAGLIEIRSSTRKSFRLSKKGRVLLNSLPKRSGCRIADRAWYQNSLFYVWSRNAESRTTWSELTESGRDLLMSIHIDKGFNKLRTSAHNRISAYQFILYTSNNLTYHLNISCGFDDMKKKLQSMESHHQGSITFYWSEKDDSGYILK